MAVNPIVLLQPAQPLHGLKGVLPTAKTSQAEEPLSSGAKSRTGGSYKGQFGQKMVKLAYHKRWNPYKIRRFWYE